MVCCGENEGIARRNTFHMCFFAVPLFYARNAEEKAARGRIFIYQKICVKGKRQPCEKTKGENL